MTVVSSSSGSLDFGRAIAETWIAIGKNRLVFVGLVLVFGGLPWLIVQLVDPNRNPLAKPGSSRVALQLCETAIYLLANTWRALTTQRLMLDTMGGGRRSLREALIVGARATPILLPLAIVVNWSAWVTPLLWDFGAWKSLGMVQFVAFLSTLLFLALWGVVEGVILSEKRGLSAALSRSAALMKTSRWRFVLTYCLCRIIATVPQFFAPMLIATLSNGGLNRAVWISIYGAMTCFSLLLNAAFGVFGAAYYRELCRARDGVVFSEVALVFD